jgi:hypothetical protein
MCYCCAGFCCCIWLSPLLSLLQRHWLRPRPFLPLLCCHDLAVKDIIVVVIIVIIVAVIVLSVFLVVVVAAVEFNCLLVGGNILHVGVVIVDHPPNFLGRSYWRYLVFWIARTAQRQTKSREAWLLVVRVEEDRIIAHGVVRSRLIVKLNLEVV